jgi:hypothetical protein
MSPFAESPLRGLPLVQSSVRPAGIALMGSAIPRCRLPFSPAGGVPNRPSLAEGLFSANAPLIEFRRPPGSCPDDASQYLSAPAPSVGFRSLGHMHHTRSGSHGLCLPATFRPQGLITLSTVCALARLAGLVSCRQRLWDSPFGAFSSSKVALAFRPTHDPHAVTVKTPPSWTFGPRRLRALQARLPGASFGESLAGAAGCLARRTAGGSLGFRPFQGFRPLVWAGPSTRLLSRA